MHAADNKVQKTVSEVMSKVFTSWQSSTSRSTPLDLRTTRRCQFGLSTVVTTAGRKTLRCGIVPVGGWNDSSVAADPRYYDLRCHGICLFAIACIWSTVLAPEETLLEPVRKFKARVLVLCAFCPSVPGLILRWRRAPRSRHSVRYWICCT